MKPLALGLIAAAAIALASTTNGAWLIIGTVALAFLALGPGLSAWQRMKRTR